MSGIDEIGRRAFLGGALATAGGTALARPPMFAGGHGAGPTVVDPDPEPTAGTYTNFTLTNTTATATRAMKRFGQVFPPGKVLPGTVLKARQADGTAVPMGVHGRSTYPDGSLRVAICSLRDDADVNLAANESRIYEIYGESGTYQTTSPVTLAQVLSGRTLRVDVTNFTSSTNPLGGVTPVSHPAHHAIINNHALVTTRVTQFAFDPVCPAWEIWGFFTDGTTEHQDLKINTFIYAWLNSNGTIHDVEIGAELAQDWYDGVKTFKYYDATLKNNTTTIQSYTGVKHAYHQRWIMVRSQDDDQGGAYPWLSGNRPTIIFKPNQADWVKSRMIPPIAYQKTHAMPAYSTAYVPGSGQGHRLSRDDGAGYVGRGLITHIDVVTFSEPTALNIRKMRLGAHAGIHEPTQMRSRQLRTRPGDNGVQDYANTAFSFILTDERGTAGTPLSYYDFRADGMPVPSHAYTSWDYAGAMGQQATPAWVKPVAGISYWYSGFSKVNSGSSWTGWRYPNQSHGVNYAYFPYLYEGDRHNLHSCIDHAMFGNYALHGSSFLAFNPLMGTSLYGHATTEWQGIGAIQGTGGERSAAWSINQFSAACAITPVDSVYHGAINRMAEHMNRWITLSIAKYPNVPYLGWSPYAEGGNAAYMGGFLIQAFYAAYDRLRLSGFRDAGKLMVQKDLLGIQNSGFMIMNQSFAWMARPSHEIAYNATTNRWFNHPLEMFEDISVATDGTFTYRFASPPAGGASWRFWIDYDWTQGGWIVYNPANDGSTKLIPEMPLGQIFFMRNVVDPASGTRETGTLTFKISATETGPTLTFATAAAERWFCLLLKTTQRMTRPVIPAAGSLGSGDNVGPQRRAGAVLAYQHGDMTAAEIAVWDTFWNPSFYNVTSSTSYGSVWDFTTELPA